MAKLMITKQMENQALLKSARMVHRRWETVRLAMAIIISNVVEKDVDEVLSLKWADIDFKGGVIKKWNIVSTETLALLHAAKEYEIMGSEYVFPDRWGMIIEGEKFEEIRERIDEEAGLSDLLSPINETIQ